MTSVYCVTNVFVHFEADALRREKHARLDYNTSYAITWNFRHNYRVIWNKHFLYFKDLFFLFITFNMQMMPIEIRQKPVNKSLCARSSSYNQVFFITRAFAMHLRKVKCCVTKHVQHDAYNFIYKTVYTCITIQVM